MTRSQFFSLLSFIPGYIVAVLSLYIQIPGVTMLWCSGFGFTLSFFSLFFFLSLDQKSFQIILLSALIFLCYTASIFLPMQRIDGFLVYPFLLPIVFLFLDGAIRIKQMFDRKDKLEEMTKKEKLAHSSLLQEEIHPHFLFNALTIVNYIYSKDTVKGKEAMEKLKEILNLMDKSRGKLSLSLREEERFILAYLDFTSSYSGKKIRFELIGDRDIQVPNSLLETLVENSVIHGKVFEKEDGLIQVKVEEKDGLLSMEVIDNGVGIDSKTKTRPSYGLENIQTRVTLLGGSYQAIGKKGSGYQTKIVIPERKNADV